jgi:hypothetical protein
MAERVAETPHAPAAAREPQRAEQLREPDVDVRGMHAFSMVPVLQRQEEPESEAMRARRLAAAAEMRAAAMRILRAIAGNFVWRGIVETPVAGGFEIPSTGATETFAARTTRLRRLVAELLQLADAIEAAPVPEARYDRDVPIPGGYFQVGGRTQPMADMLTLYIRRQVELASTADLISTNFMYLYYGPSEERYTPPQPRAVRTGIYLIVDDPEGNPLEYHRISPTEPFSRGVIVDVWRDETGYFYRYEGRRVDLPERP